MFIIDAIRRWFAPPQKPARKPRPKMPTTVCPACRRLVAYSPNTGTTARHRCIDGTFAQERLTITSNEDPS